MLRLSLKNRPLRQLPPRYGMVASLAVLGLFVARRVGRAELDLELLLGAVDLAVRND